MVFHQTLLSTILLISILNYVATFCHKNLQILQSNTKEFNLVVVVVSILKMKPNRLSIISKRSDLYQSSVSTLRWPSKRADKIFSVSEWYCVKISIIGIT